MQRLHNSSRCASRLPPLLWPPLLWPPLMGPPAHSVLHLLCLQEGFVEFFQVPDPESTVRNVLMAVAGVAGIGATLALLIR